MYLPKDKLDISNGKESPLIYSIFKTKSGRKYQRQREFHISELGKFLKTTYQRSRRHPRSFVYTVLDQMVHYLQPTTTSQTG